MAMLALLAAPLLLESAGEAAEVSFTRDLAPVVVKQCAGCHGDRANLGGYRAHTFQALLKAGATGAAAVVPGQPDKSSLYQLLTHKSAQKRMPKGGEPLPSAQVALFRRWITEGAKFDGPDPQAPLKSLLGAREHPVAPAAYPSAVPVMAVALAPGGKEVFVGGYHEVTVWDADTGKLLRRLQRLPQRIHSLAFSPDGKQLAVGGGTPGEYGEMALVDLATGKRSRALDSTGDLILSVAFSADGQRIAAGGADASVRVYETATGRRVWSSKVHSDWVTSVGFSRDGRFVASAGKDKTVKVYDAGDGALFTTYNGHNRMIGQYRGQHSVYALQFVPGGLPAATAGGGKWIQLWDPVVTREENGTAADMESRFSKPGHAKYLEHGFTGDVYALLSRGGQLFAASADGLIKQFDLATMKEVRAFTGHTDWVFGLDYDPASGRLASGSYNGEVRVWDSKTGESLAVFKARPSAAMTGNRSGVQ